MVPGKPVPRGCGLHLGTHEQAFPGLQCPARWGRSVKGGEPLTEANPSGLTLYSPNVPNPPPCLESKTPYPCFCLPTFCLPLLTGSNRNFFGGVWPSAGQRNLIRYHQKAIQGLCGSWEISAFLLQVSQELFIGHVPWSTALALNGL